ncbi:MAG: hypothetical protein QOD74_1754 [Variibacter sp.]|nr:hypothetical protein [Variibacter sp.]
MPVVALGLGRQMTFWICALGAFVVAVWLLSPILLPFVGGMALAYLFNPLATRLERLGVSRLIASLAIVAAFVLAFVLIMLLVAPVLGGQVAGLIENLPGYVRRLQSVITDPSIPWLRRLLGENFTTDATLNDFVTQGVGWMGTFLKSLWSGGAALVSLLSLLIVMPVVAFYMLNDWNRMLVKTDSWVPLQQRPTVRHLAREVDEAIAAFVRGQTGVCLVLGSFYAIALSVAGLKFGLLIGLVSGLISFIPYVGSMTGLVLSTSVAVAQFYPEWGHIAAVVAIFFAGQFLEGYVLQPKLVGESVGLHPVWIIFAIFAFGYLFGFVGMLLAVPLAAAIAVFARFALSRYLDSPFYTGEPIAAAEARPPSTIVVS